MRYKCYARQEEIRTWALEGLGVTEIAQKLEIANPRHVRTFLRKHGIPYQKQSHAMEKNPAWRGGRVIDKDGYVLVKAPLHPQRDRHGYVREHRLVMETHLGRVLLPSEVVHHRDDNKLNNQIENLELFGSNGEHLAVTLKGKIPNWTQGGASRMPIGLQRASQWASGLDAGRSPETTGPTPR